MAEHVYERLEEAVINIDSSRIRVPETVSLELFSEERGYSICLGGVMILGLNLNEENASKEFQRVKSLIEQGKYRVDYPWLDSPIIRLLE